MLLFLKKKFNKILLILFIVLVCFTRLYNLNQTARFTQDESSDLARMKNYFLEKKITLVGPISSDNSKVFSSLTYYMVMPFAALTNFEPIGPVYGTAFFGILTAFLLLAAVYKVNKRFTIPVGALIVVWYPLLEMSRWAWNPHFVVFWASLALLAYLNTKSLHNWSYLLTGIFLATLFHHHYLAFLATSVIIFYMSLLLIKSKKYKSLIILLVAYALPFLPFILFDLRHPPGLFITRYLISGQTPHVEYSLTVSTALIALKRNLLIFLQSLSMNKFFQIILAIQIIGLTILDLRKKAFHNLVWLLPTASIILVGIALNEYQIRYIYPSLTFFLMWIITPRKFKIASQLSWVIVLTLLISSVISVYPQLTTKTNPDMYSFTQATRIIEKTIKEHSLDNSNVAALASKETAPLADTYRDVVRMNGAGLRASSEYGVSENLFVVSTSSEAVVRADESYAMIAFKEASLKNVFTIPNSEWIVYWYGY